MATRDEGDRWIFFKLLAFSTFSTLTYPGDQDKFFIFERTN